MHTYQQAKWWTRLSFCIAPTLRFSLLPWASFSSSIDRKPSTPLKEEICKKTNLSMRVVRVWFQNKRCKEKKDRLRQDGWDLVTAQPDTLPSTVRYFQHHCLPTICMHTAHRTYLLYYNYIYFIHNVHNLFHAAYTVIRTWSLVPDITHSNIQSSISHHRRVQSSSILTFLTPPCWVVLHGWMASHLNHSTATSHTQLWRPRPLDICSMPHLYHSTPAPLLPHPCPYHPPHMPSTTTCHTYQVEASP